MKGELISLGMFFWDTPFAYLEQKWNLSFSSHILKKEMMLSSHKSGVVYNNKTIYHSLVVHELVANSVLLDYLKYCFNCFRLVSLWNIWITKNLNIIPIIFLNPFWIRKCMSEEMEKVLGNYSKHDSHLRLPGGVGSVN